MMMTMIFMYKELTEVLARKTQKLNPYIHTKPRTTRCLRNLLADHGNPGYKDFTDALLWHGFDPATIQLACPLS